MGIIENTVDESDKRFAAYVAGLVSVLGHADRARPLRDYCTGLVMDRAAFHPAHTPHPGLGGQFLQQRLGIFKVWRVEALGEPVVDFGE